MRPAPTIAAAVLLAGCSMEIEYEDVSAHPVYARAVGARYEVVGNLTAYGIRTRSRGPAEYVTLQTAPGFAGREIVFRQWIRPGAIVTVRRVLDSNVVTDCPLVLEVDLSGLSKPLPVDVVTYYDLDRNNGDGDCDGRPHPDVLRRLD